MSTKISSSQNPQFKALKKILAHPGKADHVLLEGYRAYEQLMADQQEMEVFLEEDREYIEGATILTKELFKEIVVTENPQGIFCKVEKREKPFDGGMILLLDGIQDPGNLGTLLRSAHAFGVNNVLLMKGSCSIYNDKVLRSSMGAIMNLSIQERAGVEDVEKRLEEGYRLICAETQGKSYKELKPGKLMLCIGNEAKGIRQELKDLCSEEYTIPMKGTQESLNAAIAGSIFMAHLQEEL